MQWSLQVSSIFSIIYLRIKMHFNTQKQIKKYWKPGSVREIETQVDNTAFLTQ